MSAAVEPEVVEHRHGGLRLVGQRWRGGGAADDVVLLHGGGQTRHSWARTGERLSAAGWTVLAMDLRGHGDSDWDPRGDYSLQGFVGDLVDLLEAAATPPVLVGASLGGITSLVVAGEHPGLASGLVLVDVVVRVEPEGVDRIRRFLMAHHEGFENLEQAAETIAAYNPNRRRSPSLDGLRKNLRLRADGRWYWHWDPDFIRIGDEPQRHIEPERLEKAALALEVPVLIVRGGRSDVVSDQGVKDMLALVPTATAVDAPAAGHMVAGDDNDIFTASLEAFLRRVRDES